MDIIVFIIAVFSLMVSAFSLFYSASVKDYEERLHMRDKMLIELAKRLGEEEFVDNKTIQYHKHDCPEKYPKWNA